jgi:pimeloyl-ACP methyl ester carboxylesterase
MPDFHAADGTRLSYESYGEGPPVLFCNSVMLSTNMWEYQIPYLVDHGYRCVLLDWRGHGRSDRPAVGYDIQTLADDVAVLVNLLDLCDIRLVGHSMGAAVSVRYLNTAGGSRVRNLTLLSPMLPYLKQTSDNPDGVPEALFAAGMAALRTDRTRWLADQQQAFFASHLRPISPCLIDWTRRDCESASMYAVIALQHQVFHQDNRTFVDAVDVPTLIIHGAADFSAPVEITGRRTALAIPHAAYREFPDAGHGIYASHHAAVNDELLGFLN